jgi:hypothetical protein
MDLGELGQKTILRCWVVLFFEDSTMLRMIDRRYGPFLHCIG